MSKHYVVVKPDSLIVCHNGSLPIKTLQDAEHGLCDIFDISTPGNLVRYITEAWPIGTNAKETCNHSEEPANGSNEEAREDCREIKSLCNQVVELKKALESSKQERDYINRERLHYKESKSKLEQVLSKIASDIELFLEVIYGTHVYSIDVGLDEEVSQSTTETRVLKHLYNTAKKLIAF